MNKAEALLWGALYVPPEPNFETKGTAFDTSLRLCEGSVPSIDELHSLMQRCEAEHKAWLLKTFKHEYPLILASENLSPEMEAIMPQLAAIPGVTVKRSKYLKAGEVYSMNNPPLFPPSPSADGHADEGRKDGEK